MTRCVPKLAINRTVFERTLAGVAVPRDKAAQGAVRNLEPTVSLSIKTLAQGLGLFCSR